MDAGKLSALELVRGIPEAHREHRPHWPNAEFDHPAQSGRSASPPTSTPHGGSSDRARSSTASRSCSRTTSTPPTRCRRPPGRWRWSGRRPQDAVVTAGTARGRGDHPRQGQPERVGQLPLDALVERLERAGRQTRNPYALDRNPSGSSSGSGVAAAASLRRGDLGTETNGSIVCPRTPTASSGSSPTVGLTSRAGVIPIAHSQDTVGPMAAPVADAAAVLGALTGLDTRDPAMARQAGPVRTPTTPSSSTRDALRGARIGVARARLLRLQRARRRGSSRRRDHRARGAGRDYRRPGRHPDRESSPSASPRPFLRVQGRPSTPTSPRGPTCRCRRWPT